MNKMTSEYTEDTTDTNTVFDIRYFKEPKGFLNLGVHIDYKTKNMQLFIGRWHVSMGWHIDEGEPFPFWTSLIAYND